MAIIGETPPTPSPTAKQYTDCGLPWFDFYGGDSKALAGPSALKGLASVAAHAHETEKAPLPDNGALQIKHVVSLRRSTSRQVRESSGSRPMQ